MTTEIKIIRQLGRYAILAQSHEVALRDGAIIKLHLLKEGRNPEPARLLRAFVHPEAGAFIFDLGDVAKTLQKDLRECLTRDAPGMVHLTLRQFFPTGALLRAAIYEHAFASGAPGHGDDAPTIPTHMAALVTMAKPAHRLTA